MDKESSSRSEACKRTSPSWNCTICPTCLNWTLSRACRNQFSPPAGSSMDSSQRQFSLPGMPRAVMRQGNQILSERIIRRRRGCRDLFAVDSKFASRNVTGRQFHKFAGSPDRGLLSGEGQIVNLQAEILAERDVDSSSLENSSTHISLKNSNECVAKGSAGNEIQNNAHEQLRRDYTPVLRASLQAIPEAPRPRQVPALRPRQPLQVMNSNLILPSSFCPREAPLFTARQSQSRSMSTPSTSISVPDRKSTYRQWAIITSADSETELMKRLLGGSLPVLDSSIQMFLSSCKVRPTTPPPSPPELPLWERRCIPRPNALGVQAIHVGALSR